MKPGGHLQLNPPIMFTHRNWQLCCLVEHSSKSKVKSIRTHVSIYFMEIADLWCLSQRHLHTHGDSGHIQWAWADQDLTWTSLRTAHSKFSHENHKSREPLPTSTSDCIQIYLGARFFSVSAASSKSQTLPDSQTTLLAA